MLLSLQQPNKGQHHRRTSSGIRSAFMMTYSSGNLPGLEYEVDPELVNTLEAEKQPVLRTPSLQR